MQNNIWGIRLFQLYVVQLILGAGIWTYSMPTITKHMGVVWEPRTIAVWSTAAMAMGLLQTPVAKWVPRKVILWGDALICIPSGVLMVMGSWWGVGLICFKITGMFFRVFGSNVDALMWEAMGKSGELSQMKTREGTIFAAVGLASGALAIICPPPSAQFCFMLGGICNLLHFPLCVFGALETTKILKAHAEQP